MKWLLAWQAPDMWWHSPLFWHSHCWAQSSPKVCGGHFVSQTEPSQPAGQEQAPVLGSQPPLTQEQTLEQSEPHIPSWQTKQEIINVKTSLCSPLVWSYIWNSRSPRSPADTDRSPAPHIPRGWSRAGWSTGGHTGSGSRSSCNPRNTPAPVSASSSPEISTDITIITTVTSSVSHLGCDLIPHLSLVAGTPKCEWPAEDMVAGLVGDLLVDCDGDRVAEIQ